MRNDTGGPVVAPVVAQAWRGGSRQARLARLPRGCDVEELGDGHARSVGELLGKAGTTDIVDACVVDGSPPRDVVATTDIDDMSARASAVNRRLELERA